MKPPKANSFTLSSDPLRDQKNLAIVDITLVSRALIDTGYSAEAIFILTDAFIRNVDECKDAEEAKAIARACAIHCTELRAKELQQERAGTGVTSPLVQQACEYMERHVYAKLDVKAIAAELKVSVGYLSKIFKRERHCTMSDYMRAKKIEIALSLSLSFCSQSHFGAFFSKAKGCSPSTYRKLSRLKRKQG
ncbi:MAG: AraC family transcriptional regulator [Anaerobiospirillum sp.]|nr:AraC family transcriptional regulator [Anaerobiospirillum sp.]